MTDQTARIVDIDERGDLNAPPGTPSWAIAMRRELLGVLHDTESSSQRLQRLAEAMLSYHGFVQLRDASGHPFPSYDAFCRADPPFGLGLDPETLDGIVRERQERELRARVQAAAIKTTGIVVPPGNSRQRQTPAHRLHDRATHAGISRATQHRLDNLARCRPDLLTEVQAGRLSVYAACVEAGLIIPRVTIILDAEKAARTLAHKMPREQLRALVARLQHVLADDDDDDDDDDNDDDDDDAPL